MNSIIIKGGSGGSGGQAFIISIAAFPLKIVGTDGSPVRAVAMEIEE